MHIYCYNDFLFLLMCSLKSDVNNDFESPKRTPGLSNS